jgi:lipopolysaccharide transport system ATP-binding protein
MDAVVARDVTKTYRMGVGRARIREAMPWPMDRAAAKLFPKWWRRDTFNALEDISLSVPSGSSLGIVGHNGAGKTTLLRLVAGVAAPTTGTIETAGRVGALIDVLVGFHPELTGRENILLMGAVYGFGRAEMTAKIDEILDFAEIDELADTPLKRYSAGMGARLGFGTLSALDVDVLLVDEILAVGDASFQRKCITWLDEYRNQGHTLLFVSHNLSLVRNMTERTISLNQGRIVEDGPTREVLPRYARAMERRDTDAPAARRSQVRKAARAGGLDRWGAGGARVEKVHVNGADEEGEGVEVVISYEAPKLDRAVFCVGFVDDAGQSVGVATSTSVPVNGGRIVLREPADNAEQAAEEGGGE